MRSVLRKHGLEWEEKDVVNNSAHHAEMIERSGQMMQPCVEINGNSFVLRGPRGPLDTLSWEGYREGYDDARYLATLQNAITQCRTTGRRLGLITGVETWLDNLPTDIDLDSWRREMAIRTEKLMGLKATVTPPKAQR